MSTNPFIPRLRAILGASARFWPTTSAKLDDYYEVFAWAETIAVATLEKWSVKIQNAPGATFTFRRGPGRICSGVPYTYAELTRGTFNYELHTGVRIAGVSAVAHEFDVVCLEASAANVARHRRTDPTCASVTLHIECKYHRNDLSLGTARALIGLGRDCMKIRPMLISKGKGPDSIRQLVKAHRCTYVHHVHPAGTGVTLLHNCIRAFLP